METGAHTAIETFIERVSDIHEADYGDFMRRANLYLNDLKKELAPYVSGEEKRKIDDIQLHLQFIPTWEIEPTRRQVVDAARDLERSPLLH